MGAAGRSSLPRHLQGSGERVALARTAAEAPPLDDTFGALLDAGLDQMSLTLDAGARAALDAQARLMLAWNEHINLTALRSPEQVARGHLLDSLMAVPVLRDLGAAAGRGRARPALLDLGSGAGYPGLPVGLVLPAARIALVDSVAKKAAFLDAAIDAAHAALDERGAPAPEMVALGERAEDLADDPDHRAAWDIVVARAVGSVAEVAELGLPLARVGGSVVAWKRGGDGALDDEVAAAAAICRAAGGTRPRIAALADADRLGLPGHCLVIIGKTRATPERFPRPAGERRRRALP